MGKFRADKVDKNSESYKIFKRERKKKRALKSSRLILRNLSFKCNEDDVKNHFSQFGNILEVQLLRKDDKFIGCGFVQFEKKNCAAKAIIKANGSKFMGRPVIVDWAVAKDKFYKIKSDPKKEGDVEIKEEVLSDDATDALHLNSKEKEFKENCDNDSESNSDMEVGETTEEGLHENDDDSEEEDEDDDDDDDDDEEEDDEDDDEEEDDDNKFGTEDEDTKPKIKIKSELMDKPRKPRVTVADESHTVFVKNVPFSVTGDDLKEYAEEFGPVNYALVCMDSLTEHSKGTGFIQFKNAEIAQKVIDGEIKLRIRGTSLIALKPMSKEEIQTSQTKTKDPKDKRNLYLVKEGVILAGSPAAVGISNGDMAKRLQLDNWKSQTLRNLHMFVSPTRLVIHNLPLSYNDTQLRKLFLNNAPKGSVITEARVMKNMKEYKTTGEPKSNGYGFVSFRRHEDALEALRKLNNNPSIFQPNRRPIVAFSIENKRALKVKERRLLNSKLNIPNKNEEPQVKTENKTPKSGKQNRKKNKTKNDPKIPKPLTSTSSDEKPKTWKKPMKSLKVKKTSHDTDEDKPSYAGISARYGSKKLRSKKELINQQMKHFQETKKLKRAKKLSRKQKRSVRQRNVNK